MSAEASISMAAQGRAAVAAPHNIVHFGHVSLGATSASLEDSPRIAQNAKGEKRQFSLPFRFDEVVGSRYGSPCTPRRGAVSCGLIWPQVCVWGTAYRLPDSFWANIPGLPPWHL